MCPKMYYYYVLIRAEWLGSALKTEHMYTFHLSTPVSKLHYKSACYENHLEFSSDPFFNHPLILWLYVKTFTVPRSERCAHKCCSSCLLDSTGPVNKTTQGFKERLHKSHHLDIKSHHRKPWSFSPYSGKTIRLDQSVCKWSQVGPLAPWGDRGGEVSYNDQILDPLALIFWK